MSYEAPLPADLAGLLDALARDVGGARGEMSESLLDFDWDCRTGVRAAFTTRLGGVSAAPWDSFNVATHVGDDPAHVAANRARLKRAARAAGGAVWLNQVHGTDV